MITIEALMHYLLETMLLGVGQDHANGVQFI